MRRIFFAALLIGKAILAQGPDADLRSKIASVRYPPLAKAARVHGDVHLTLKSGVVTVISGPPLLTRTAVENAKTFGSVKGGEEIDVFYHFAFVNAATPVAMMVRRGNAFERAMLRVLGLKTEKTILVWCGEPPPNDLKTSDTMIEVWIFETPRCYPTVSSSTLIAHR